MAHLAIKGHATRGKEVIGILEMMGGINECDYRAKHDSFCYYIGNENNIICYDWVVDCCEDEDTLVFTLEEFLEEFPYKVGDEVLYKTYGIYSAIKTMKWNAEKEQVFYRLDSKKLFVATVDELKPCKKEPMEERKYSELRMPLDDDDKLATEATIDGDKITSPENHLIGKITKVDNGMLVEFVKKQPKYPKTFIECAKILDCFGAAHIDGYKGELLDKLQELLICRGAYWKIAGEQMGLGKPWEPYWTIYKQKFCLGTDKDKVIEECVTTGNRILTFPTKEMRDAFYENFKGLIETCKELL